VYYHKTKQSLQANPCCCNLNSLVASYNCAKLAGVVAPIWTNDETSTRSSNRFEEQSEAVAPQSALLQLKTNINLDTNKQNDIRDFSSFVGRKLFFQRCVFFPSASHVVFASCMSPRS